MFRPWENVQPDNNGEEIQIEDEEPLEEEMNRKDLFYFFMCSLYNKYLVTMSVFRFLFYKIFK
jgi:hypothetical protein